jgi:hypothetical protein
MRADFRNKVPYNATEQFIFPLLFSVVRPAATPERYCIHALPPAPSSYYLNVSSVRLSKNGHHDSIFNFIKYTLQNKAGSTKLFDFSISLATFFIIDSESNYIFFYNDGC